MKPLLQSSAESDRRIMAHTTPVIGVGGGEGENFKKMENLGWENLVKIQGLSKLAIL